MKKWLSIIALLLLGLSLGLWGKVTELKKENGRLSDNATALMDRATYYETEADKSAASVQRLKLDYSELKEHYTHVCKTADELGVKVKRLQAAATTATKTEVKVVTQIRDSIIFRNGEPDSLKMLQWRDAWVNVAGEIRGNDVSLDVVSNDTIKQIIHKVPKKFWFIKWGCKAIRQEVVSTNPHTKITYTEYIEIK